MAEPIFDGDKTFRTLNLEVGGNDGNAFVIDVAGTDKIVVSASGGEATITLDDGTNIALDATTGTKIGTATTQKLGFFNATPVVQRTVVADPSGGATQDAEARTAIIAVITRLEQLGLFASA